MLTIMGCYYSLDENISSVNNFVCVLFFSIESIM